MFAELMPLLAGRTVLITVAKVEDMTLRVNVIPSPAKAGRRRPAYFPGSKQEQPETPDMKLEAIYFARKVIF